MLVSKEEWIGQRFERLIVKDMAYQKPEWYATCQCDCGRTTKVRRKDLGRGVVRSCGCLRREQAGLRRRKDYTDQRFGRLVVESMEYYKEAGYAWCQCDCGGVVRVLAKHLQKGHTQSCGCFFKEQRLLRQQARRKDLSGMRFNRLVVQAMEWHNGQGYAICECDCGCSDVRVSASNLQSRQTRSCGCIKQRTPEEKYVAKRATVHRRLARVRGLCYSFDRESEAFLRAYWGDSCAICGAQADFWHVIAWDHWIPLTHPACPGTVPENILPLCHGRKGAATLPGARGCNNSKFQKDPIVWLTQRLGVRKAQAKLRQIEAYFIAARTHALAVPKEQALIEDEQAQRPLVALPPGPGTVPPGRNGTARQAA
jgi:hypothetical protein